MYFSWFASPILRTTKAGNATASSSTDVEMNVVAGVDPFVYVIEELDQSSAEPAGFDVRVSALNSAGHGRPSAALNIKVRYTWDNVFPHWQG